MRNGVVALSMPELVPNAIFALWRSAECTTFSGSDTSEVTRTGMSHERQCLGQLSTSDGEADRGVAFRRPSSSTDDVGVSMHESQKALPPVPCPAVGLALSAAGRWRSHSAESEVKRLPPSASARALETRFWV